MEKLVIALVLGGLLMGLVRLIAAPIRLAWKLAANGLVGLVSLWLVNLAAGITGLFIPINAVTALTAGLLGLPGICLLAVVEIWI